MTASENTRVGQMTNYDKITRSTDLELDGSLNPDEALKQASRCAVQHFQMIADYREIVNVPVEQGGALPKGVPISRFHSASSTHPIEELDLTVRAFNRLKRSGITRVGQVLMMSRDDLLAVRNFGEKSLNESKDTLIGRGFLPKWGRTITPAPLMATWTFKTPMWRISSVHAAPNGGQPHQYARGASACGDSQHDRRPLYREHITTTEARAKAVRGEAERLIAIAIRGQTTPGRT